MAYGYVTSYGRGEVVSGIVLYDLAAGKAVRRIRDFYVGGMDLVFLLDGRLAAIPTASVQARLRADLLPSSLPAERARQVSQVTIWNPGDGKIDQRVSFPGDAEVNFLIPKRNALASLDGGAWVLRDLPTSMVTQSIAAAVNQCSPSATPENRRALQSFSIHRILAVTFFPDRPGRLLGVNDDGVAYLWNIANGKDLEQGRLATPADFVAISENSRTVAAARKEGTVDLVRAYDGSYTGAPLTNIGQRITTLAASPNGEKMFFGGEDGALGILEVKHPATILRWQGHSGPIRAIASSPDGEILASCAEDLTLKVWSASSGALVQTLEGHGGKLNALAFAPGPNGLLASGGDDSNIKLWDVNARRVLKTLKEHDAPIRSMSFSPDGSILVSGADDGLRAWNVKSGKTVRILLENSAEWAVEGEPTAGRPAGFGRNDMTVTSIRFSPDGRLVACGGTNNTAIVWDTKTWGRRSLRPTEK
jgi:WD40 repeat protein